MKTVADSKSIDHPGRKSFFSSHKNEEVPFFQSKLKVGPADDAFEREADDMAARIVDGDSHYGSRQHISPVAVQRKCSTCEEEEKLQRKTDNEKGMSNEAPPVVSEAIHTAGESLDQPTKAFMESKFGYDFSDVKIHTGNIAAKSAESIHAKAYTSGTNVVFNEGQYDPRTQSGKKLLAHELTHVVQQGKSSSVVQREPKAEEKSKVVCPTFPANGVKVIGSSATDLVSILSVCSGSEVTIDASKMLKLSGKAAKGAKKNPSAKTSVSNIINNKVGIIVDTNPKSIGTTVGAFDHDCPGRQFINVSNILVQDKATGSGGGLDSCSSVLHEMSEAVKARSLGAKVKGDDLFKQSHAEGTTVENAIRKDAGLPLRDQAKGDLVMIGKISDKEMLILESNIFGQDKAAKTQLNVLVCTLVPTGDKEMSCINEVKASHVVDGIVTFSTRDQAIDVFNKYASDFGFKPLKTEKKDAPSK